MADPAPAEAGALPEANEQSTWASFARSTLRSLVFYWLFRQIASGFFGKSSPASSPSIGLQGSAVKDINGAPLKAFVPVWSLGTLSDLYVFVSPRERAADVPFADPNALLWSEKALVFGSDSRAKDLVLPCTPVHLPVSVKLILLTKCVYCIAD